jgi:hypothetical protein
VGGGGMLPGVGGCGGVGSHMGSPELNVRIYYDPKEERWLK